VVRVAVVTDRSLVDDIPRAVADILAAVPRGSVMIQVREKDLDGGPLLRLVREVLEVARPAGAPVWVNDRVDVALAAGAEGVHLPERGLSIADARAAAVAAGRTLAIGCSRHTSQGVRAAVDAGADLIQLGPIWSTPNKGEPLGVEPLAVKRSLPASTQLVAVGGIDTAERAHRAAAAGADAVAVIRAAWQGSPVLIAELVAAVADAAGTAH
jgi:thiamine-phosphate pyrophosphorylase